MCWYRGLECTSHYCEDKKNIIEEDFIKINRIFFPYSATCTLFVHGFQARKDVEICVV